MNDKLRKYVDFLFKDAPKGKKTDELKEEFLQNLMDKFCDLKSQGKTDEEAYNITATSVGDVEELINGLKANANPQPIYTQEQIENDKKRSALCTAIAVCLYIVCVIPLFILQNEMGLILLFVIVAIATAILIYNNMTRLNYSREDDEDDIEKKDPVNYRGFKAITSAVWSLTLVIYFIVSFTTGAWHISWIIFLIAVAVNSIIKAVYDFRRG